MHFKCTVPHTASFLQTHLFWLLHRRILCGSPSSCSAEIRILEQLFRRDPRPLRQSEQLFRRDPRPLRQSEQLFRRDPHPLRQSEHLFRRDPRPLRQSEQLFRRDPSAASIRAVVPPRCPYEISAVAPRPLYMCDDTLDIPTQGLMRRSRSRRSSSVYGTLPVATAASLLLPSASGRRLAIT